MEECGGQVQFEVESMTHEHKSALVSHISIGHNVEYTADLAAVSTSSPAVAHQLIALFRVVFAG